MVIIQPFTYQMSTAFKERVDLADKLNEVINLLNAWGDVPEQFEQVQEQIQTIGQQINDITTKISTIETNLGQLQTTVTNLGAKLNRAAVASTLSTSDHIDSEKVGIAIDSIDGTTNKVSYLVGATAENAGLMTAADKEKLDDAITEIPIASTTQLGGIKVGNNLQISEDGTLNATGGGGGEVSLPAHIVGANDANALVSVSPVRQDGNLFIRTTYKDYTTAGTTAKNVDGGPFPIASAEDSGLMAATDKQTLNDVKDTTDAMSTRVDTIQSNLDTLEQNFQDLKGDMLTNPAEVVQVADETHDGIITKEKFSEIGSPFIPLEKYGFFISDNISLTPSSKINCSYGSQSYYPITEKGIGISSNKLLSFINYNGIKMTTAFFKPSDQAAPHFTPSSLNKLYLWLRTSSTPYWILLFSMMDKEKILSISIRPSTLNFAREPSYDKSINGTQYYCFSIKLNNFTPKEIGINVSSATEVPTTPLQLIGFGYRPDEYGEGEMGYASLNHDFQPTLKPDFFIEIKSN